jgi:NTP pyrophosphatase (non-canonical NTP hydrolase)
MSHQEFAKEWARLMNSDNKVTILDHVHPTITHLCEEAYQTAKSKGWHDEKRETGTLLMLIVGEVAEAMEADRRHEGKDRVTEELADVIIRIFDFCGEKGLDLETAILEKMEFNKTRDYKHGGKAY